MATRVGRGYISVDVVGDSAAVDKLARDYNERLERASKKGGTASGTAFADRMLDSIKKRVSRENQLFVDAFGSGQIGKLAQDGETVDATYERINKRLRDMVEGYDDVVDGQLRTVQILGRERDALSRTLRNWYSKAKFAEEAAAATQAEADANERNATAAERHAKATKENEASLARSAKAAESLNNLFSDAQVRRIQRARRELADMVTAGNFDKMVRSSGGLENALDRVNQQIKELADGVTVVVDGEEKHVRLSEEVADHARDTANSWYLRRVEAARTLEHERDIDHTLRSQNGKVDHQVRLVVGRLRGSRNDFLHFIGAIGGAIERLTQVTIYGAADALRNFFDLASQNGGGARGFFAALRTTGAGAVTRLGAALRGGIVSLGAALIFLETAASVLATALSAALAGAVALAGVAWTGLTGALAFAVPLVGGLVTGFLAAIIAVDGMTDAQKDMLKPFEDWYKEVKRAVADELFRDLETQVKDFLGAVGDFGSGALTNAAEAMRESINELIEDLQTPGMQNTLSVLEEYLGKIAGHLVSIGGDALTGFLGIMAAIAPYAEAIAEDIAAAFDDWSAWVNSAEGQDSISTWFQNAWEIATKFWNIITLIGDILGELFSAGEDTGEGWLDGWIEGLQEFLDYLQSPEGQQAMEEWFQRAEDIFAKVGEVVDAILELWAVLDDDSGAGALGGVLDTIEGIIDAFKEAAIWIENVKNALKLALTDPLAALWSLIHSAIDQVISVLDGTGWFNALKDWWNGGWDRFKEWLGTLLQQDPFEIAQAIIDGFIEALAPDALIEPFKAMFNAVIDWIKDFLGIHSPSTLFRDIGIDVIEGLIRGLLSMDNPLTDAVARLVQSMVEEFVRFAEDPVGYVQDALDGILGVLESGALGPIPKAAADVARSIWDKFTPLEGRVMRPLNDTMDSVQRALDNGLTDSTEVSRRGINRIGDEFDRMQYLEEKVREPMQQIPGIISTELGRAATAARIGADGIVGAVAGIGTRIRNAFSGLSLYSTGANLMRGLAQGIVDYAYLASTAAYAAGVKAVEATKRATLTQSPSKAFMQIGQFLMEGLALGITREEAMVVRAAQAVASAIQEPFDNLDAMSGLGAPRVRVDTYSVNPDLVPTSGASPVSTGTQVVFEPGSVVLTTPATDPEILAEQLMPIIAEKVAAKAY